jgi:hypothetical protein
MKKKRFSLALSVILAIMLVFTMAPMGASAASAPKDVVVTVDYQADDSGFVIAHQDVKIHPGLAKEYGYSYGSNVKSTDITALDALVAAHILYDGGDRSAINSDLVVGSSGFLTTAFGSSANLMTFVNGEQTHTATGNTTFWDEWNGVNSYTGDAVNQSVIKAGDVVDFFTIQDTMWMDNFVWFETGGKKVERLLVAPGTEIELTAKGLMNWYALAVESDRADKTEDIEDAALTSIDIDSTGGWNVGFFSDYGSPIDTSASDGKLTLIAPASVGTYYYSAYSEDSDYPMFSPWLEVKVVNPGWAKDANGVWKYYSGTGSNIKAVTGWQTLTKDGKKGKFYFDANGVLQTGWQTISGKKYYFASTGVMATNWNNVGGKVYLHHATEGHLLTGWQNVNGKSIILPPMA